MMKRFLAFLISASLTGCAGGSQLGGLPSNQTATSAHGVRDHPSSDALGPVLTTSDGGQIFGFDVDQQGNDGIVTSWRDAEISVQTFDETTGKITKTFAIRTGKAVRKGSDYDADGILDGDVGLVDFQRAGKPGISPAHDLYHVAKPVSGEKLTGRWNPTINLFNVVQWAVNQSTPTSVFYGYQREGSDSPKLVVSNVGKNTVSKVIQLNPSQFSLGTTPQLAQDTLHDLAVIASSPSYGAAGGPPPIIATVNLKSGKVSEFGGVACPGLAGCGAPNGIAYDSATGIACTTTEIDGGVEFYLVAKQTGSYAFMPGHGGQLTAGTYVINDPIHKLFLIAQPYSSTASSGSSVQVFDESGSLMESLNGFNFTDAGDLAIPVRIAINPSKRIGWVNGPGVNQLQGFSY
jgi:hypothetical protein